MLDTLLLRLSLHFTQLHFTPLHYTCRHLTSSHLNFTQLHFTTLSFGLTPPKFPQVLLKYMRMYISVGVATGYGLDRLEIESRWGARFSATCPDWSWGPPSLLYKGYRVFPGGKERPRRYADPSPPSSVMVTKE